MNRLLFGFAAACAILLSACHGGKKGTDVPGDEEDTAPYSGIGPDETIHFAGTEPFWGGEVSGVSLKYSTPDDPEGAWIGVERFAGRNGLSFTGTYADAPFVLAVTPGKCSDGMSDRTYPFVVTLRITDETRAGCAWTDKQSYTGPQTP